MFIASCGVRRRNAGIPARIEPKAKMFCPRITNAGYPVRFESIELFFRKFVEQIGRLFALTVAFARVTGSRSITIDVDCMPKASDSRTKVGDCMTNL